MDKIFRCVKEPGAETKTAGEGTPTVFDANVCHESTCTGHKWSDRIRHSRFYKRMRLLSGRAPQMVLHAPSQTLRGSQAGPPRIFTLFLRTAIGRDCQIYALLAVVPGRQLTHGAGASRNTALAISPYGRASFLALAGQCKCSTKNNTIRQILTKKGETHEQKN